MSPRVMTARLGARSRSRRGRALAAWDVRPARWGAGSTMRAARTLASSSIALVAACAAGSPSPAVSPPVGQGRYAGSVQRDVPPETAQVTTTGAPVHVASSSAPPPARAEPSADPAPSSLTAATGAPSTPAARAANTFALELYRRAREREQGNLLLSGTSVRTALGAAYVGARGETAREMARALHLPAEPDEAARGAAAALDAWRQAAGDGAELAIASRVWTDAGLSLDPSYVARAARFGARPEPVPFQRAPDEARRTINEWTAEQTRGAIAELLSEGAVDARTRAVVTNAVWFKGRWASPFPVDATEDAPFHLAADRDVQAPTMHATETLRFADLAGVRLLELPYARSELAMLIVLPDAVDGLARVERELGPKTLDRWTAALSPRRVAVSLPRFRFASGGPMNDVLEAMGMRSAFTPKASFAGMITGKPERLGLDRVVHRTWISVDEHGTEAAAATGGVMRTTSAAVGPVVRFDADHPFLMLVRDTRTGRLLFVGRVVDPTA